VVEALRSTADVVDAAHLPLAEETECILRWLEEPGTRLVAATEPWAMPAFGAGRLRAYLAGDAGRVSRPFDDRRRLPMTSRPARA
jgi:DNA polymerase-3 subunit epsilon